MRPIVVAHHVRTGVVALNVVTAALDADARTAGTDVAFAKSPDEVALEVRNANARGARAIVLWSFYSLDFEKSAAELSAVKEATKDCDAIHVVGGVHATAEPRQTLRAGFDLLAVGEGETTFVEIVDTIARGEDPRALRGTAHLDESGSLVSHGPGERKHLDAYPAVNVRYGKWNPIEITRGCVYACSFCQTPYVFKAKFRHRSVEDVRLTTRAMVKDGVTFMRFLTPTSLSYGSDDESVNLDAVDALLAAVREEVGPATKIYFGTFPSEIRPEHVSEESLAVLARWIDNRTLILGGQSGSDRVLEETRRGHTVADIVRAVAICKKMGFRPDVDFLLGLPGETQDDRKASIDLAHELVRMGARIHSHAFMPLPGTPLRDAIPAEIEPETTRAMERLEGQGAMWGQWRRHVIAAQDLVRLRRRS